MIFPMSDFGVEFPEPDVYYGLIVEFEPDQYDGFSHWIFEDSKISRSPDLRMPAATLQTIVDTLKRDTPHIDVLITLSNLAVPPNTATRQHFNLSAVPNNADIVTFDMYCNGGVVPAAPPHLGACSSTWNRRGARIP